MPRHKGAAGRPIVVASWVEASAGAGAWVDAQQHLLEDSAAEQLLGFSLAASYGRASQGLLLSGYQVLLSPGACLGLEFLQRNV